MKHGTIVSQNGDLHSETFQILKNTTYGECSEILNGSYLPQKPRQTGQTQIRLLKKQSAFPGCFPAKRFVISSPDNQYFFRIERKKGSKF